MEESKISQILNMDLEVGLHVSSFVEFTYANNFQFS